jgi:hypothetical protein
VLYGPGARLSLAVADIDRTVQDLVTFEIDLLRPEISTASRLFAVDLAPSMRQRALEWKEPEQIPHARDA